MKTADGKTCGGGIADGFLLRADGGKYIVLQDRVHCGVILLFTLDSLVTAPQIK
jgi:hypothetical protein